MVVVGIRRAMRMSRKRRVRVSPSRGVRGEPGCGLHGATGEAVVEAQAAREAEDCAEKAEKVMGDVIVMKCVTRLDVPPERVLEEALSAGLGAVVIAGYDADGKEYFAASCEDGGETLWLLERMKLKLLRLGDE